KSSYGAGDIEVLEGLDPVRRRPGMYIGGTERAGLHHLVREILDNAVDEAMNGHADTIDVVLHQDGKSVTITDNGRGIPVDRHLRSSSPRCMPEGSSPSGTTPRQEACTGLGHQSSTRSRKSLPRPSGVTGMSGRRPSPVGSRRGR